ncbi:thiosulfate transmembrane transporter [Aureococcus anophagefferens]|nr:thiosulfate transmembrane transporter [Aureococcus anophagefferens]
MGSGPAMLALLLLAPKRPRLPRMAAIINANNTPKRRRGLPPLPTALVRGGRRGTSLKAPPVVQPAPRLPIAKALAAFAALAASATLALSRLECSLPDAAWLVATTATTTGFGDVAPITPAGRAVCCGVALAGFGLVARSRVVDDWGLVAPGDLDDARARFEALDADKTGVLSQADLDLAGDARRAASRPAGDDASEPAA